MKKRESYGQLTEEEEGIFVLLFVFWKGARSRGIGLYVDRERALGCGG